MVPSTSAVKKRTRMQHTIDEDFKCFCCCQIHIRDSEFPHLIAKCVRDQIHASHTLQNMTLNKSVPHFQMQIFSVLLFQVFTGSIQEFWFKIPKLKRKRCKTPKLTGHSSRPTYLLPSYTNNFCLGVA